MNFFRSKNDDEISSDLARLEVILENENLEENVLDEIDEIINNIRQLLGP